MIRIIFLTGAACLALTTAQAQSTMPVVLASSGYDFSAGGYSVSFTAGEMSAIETFTAGSNILTQGFHQPDLTGLGITGWTLLPETSVYPNPASDALQLSLKLEENTEVLAEIFDAQGRSVAGRNLFFCPAGETRQTISLSDLSTGVYLLKLSFTSDSNREAGFTASASRTISVIR